MVSKPNYAIWCSYLTQLQLLSATFIIYIAFVYILKIDKALEEKFLTIKLPFYSQKKIVILFPKKLLKFHVATWYNYGF